MNIVKIVAAILILLAGLYIALTPSLVYTRTPQIILFFLISILPSFLIGTEAVSKFKFKLPGFLFTTTGAYAVCLGTLVLLAHLTQPTVDKIVVYHIFDENKQPYSLNYSGAVVIPVTPDGRSITKFVDGNALILIFPKEIEAIDMQVKNLSNSLYYFGTVGYSGQQDYKIILGKDLKMAKQ